MFVCLFGIFLLFASNDLKHSADVLSSVAKCKTAVMCIRKYLCKSHSGMHYSDVGPDFNINKSVT